MAIPTALLAKVLGGLGVVAAATVTGVVVTRNKPKAKPKEDLLKALNEKIKSLGIKDTSCHLTNINTPATCTLNADALKAIKFDGKSGDTVTDNASLSLTIEKGYENFRDPSQTKDLYFPEGLRFIFKNTSDSNDITIGDSPNQITFKSNTTYDYKIKTQKDKDDTLAKAWNLTDLLNKVSLKCTNNTVNECNLEKGNVNVWKNENDYFIGGGTNSSPSTPQKKMKVTNESAGYRGGIKFSVEEEISLITTSINSKTYILNPNTNYEIDIREVDVFSVGNTQQKEKKWFLVDKTNEDLNKKIEGLGISDCKLENGATKTSECELDETKVKAINFSNKTQGSAQTVSGLDQSKKLVLVIERDYKDADFSSGLRFTFTNKNTENVTIGSSDTQITLKPGVSYDYKIKDDTKLEKAWTIATLADKVGLTCTNDTDSECTLKTTGINVWKDETDYITNAQADSNKKMTVEKDQKDYLEGFKFTVKDDEEINLQGGTKKKVNVGISKLTKAGKAYGIYVKDIGGVKTWFLMEKTTTPS